ncbi:pantoate--beta-alanine ligase [Adhaeribacter sp. BT258]|uniref:Pantothenate synthetase n=1 Tax=Adhaeribacter terrigena TaxID=2793070 RepID=A0ABS1C269_9BACT|nr:pantoate--beta-alanine ligase [Adhaeribacter terrigena]MBK0403497.1 pantoate--beta-alanine ligase [Adhaeribacter terrigena]
MKQITTINEMRAEAEKLRLAGKRIGFVPTMGALHEGHLELIRASVAENDVTVCSIFVNPTQFNNAEDFRLYPRIEQEDAVMLENARCTYLFLPAAAEMYPAPAKVNFNFGELETVMEGAHRPGHFNGVALIVSKLFHVVQPHKAYFGQKDLQQYAIIKQLVTDLDFNLNLVRFPIVREKSGLAMSSRNRRLTPEQLEIAPELYKTLCLAEEKLQNGSLSEAKSAAEAYLKNYPEIKLEYFEIADANTLQPLTELKPGHEVALCLAAFLGEIRLIDNLVLVVK